MNDIGFDPRPYCERLAKACPDRFTFYPDASTPWIDDKPNRDYEIDEPWDLWAFFGPLADERKIEPLALYKSYDKRKQSAFYRATRDERMKWHERDFTNELLESIIAAVVESFESQNESQNESEVKL